MAVEFIQQTGRNDFDDSEEHGINIVIPNISKEDAKNVKLSELSFVKFIVTSLISEKAWVSIIGSSN